MTGQCYTGSNGKRYTAGREIGRGGEGAVFEVKEEPSKVIKTYAEQLTKLKTEKLLQMITIDNEDLLRFAAWPTDVISGRDGQLCGFAMKKLEGYVPLHNLFSPMDRKKLFPDKGYNFLIHVARNLAAAFVKIHQAGIITGDVNSNNILVNASGMIALIDCDSFQMQKGSRYFFCEVGVPGYTPPELLERGSFADVVRTENTDAFSLAILIFQLLFLGRHPFTGRNLTSEDFDEEKAIRNGEFAYSLLRAGKKLLPAKNSFDLRNLSEQVIRLFHQSFENRSSRPSARKWVEALNLLSREMTTCTVSKIHQYPLKMTECPWCLFKDKAGIVYFLDDNYLESMPQLNNIEQFVNGFKPEPLNLKMLSGKYTNSRLNAAPIAQRFVKLKKLGTIVTWATVAATLIVSFFYGWAFLAVGIALLILFNFIFPSRLELQREMQIRKTNFNNLKANFEKIIEQHNHSPDVVKYDQLAAQLSGLINHFKNLPVDFNLRKKKIEERYYNQAFQTYLVQFAINEYPIPTFGAAKKQLLYNHGIVTAADISRLSVTKVNGIGPKNIQILLNWQRQMASAFTYTPNLLSINKEINFLGNKIITEKTALEADIRAAYKNLLYLRTNILTTAAALEKHYHTVATKLYQAELDLKAFEQLLK
jgi:DNA-binding helix-hairpin-helix protein with protein kinase domain